jgi:hypothetical protein
VFRLALRQTEGLIASILQLLGLDLTVPPDHTTLSRRAETLEVPRPATRPSEEPIHLLVDSTGLKLCGPGEWLVERHGTRTRCGWRKLHLATDADTGRIAASALTGHDADDGSRVGPLLDRVDGPVASLTADGAFDRDDVYAAVAARHPEAEVVVGFPRSDGQLRGLADYVWRILRAGGLSRRPPPASNGPARGRGSFRDYDLGFVHIDIKHLPKLRTADGERRKRYLYVAIDRRSRSVHLAVKDDETERSAIAFLREAAAAFPFRLTHVLTDNGSCFTPAFAKVCAELGAEYRHTRPYSPHTNGMV